jgi:hypothetical protein
MYLTLSILHSNIVGWSKSFCNHAEISSSLKGKNMSNDTKLRTHITAILTVSARRLHALTEMAKNLAGPDGEAWHVALKAQLKAGTTTTVPAQLPTKVDVVGSQQAFMQRIYDQYFPEMNVIVPVLVDIFGKVGIYVAKGLTCDMVYVAMERHFKKVWKWCSRSIDAQLDMTREARKASDGSYLVQVANGVEPDSQYLGKSTNQVDPNGTIGITLLERMLLELMYHEQTRQHLDVRGATFCSGSRYLVGRVPGVCLGSDGYVGVFRYGPDDAVGRYGVREAVTL